MTGHVTDLDRRLLALLEDGLDLAPRPYARLAEALGVEEGIILDRLGRLRDKGTISRFGVVVRHHELGYRANAMVVWDVPDARVGDCGRRLAALPFVTLSYRRPRRRPIWPYNLFCMIHGKDRDEVLAQVEEAARRGGLDGVPREVLFSRRRFKQRGARYGGTSGTSEREAAA